MTDLMEAVTSLAKRRGIAFQSSEIYGGLRLVVGLRSARGRAPPATSATPGGARWSSCATTIVGLEAAIIMRPQVWEASGHVADFTDPLVGLQELPAAVPRGPSTESRPVLPELRRCSFTEPRQFNLMFKTFHGPGRDDDADRLPAARDRAGHVRQLPERPDRRRARSCRSASRRSASRFRNEITPGNFIFRTREFEQMEMEFFVEPGTDDEWFEYWVNERLNWYLK